MLHIYTDFEISPLNGRINVIHVIISLKSRNISCSKYSPIPVEIWAQHLLFKHCDFFEEDCVSSVSHILNLCILRCLIYQLFFNYVIYFVS